MFFDEVIVKLSCISIVTSESSLPAQKSSTQNTANKQRAITIKFKHFSDTVVKEGFNDKGLIIYIFKELAVEKCYFSLHVL